MAEKGSYSLLMRLEEGKEIKVGALGNIEFPAGFYAYNGSAHGREGLSRVDRHFSIPESKHWHIDYLLPEAEILGAIVSEDSDIECELSQLDFEKVEGFGCSDCGCNSHLLYSRDKEELLEKLREVHENCSDSTRYRTP